MVLKKSVVEATSVKEENELKLAVAPLSSTVAVDNKKGENVKTGVDCNDVNHELTCVSSPKMLLVKTGSEADTGSCWVKMVSIVK